MIQALSVRPVYLVRDLVSGNIHPKHIVSGYLNNKDLYPIKLVGEKDKFRAADMMYREDARELVAKLGLTWKE
jgi:hypothetical protein